MEVHIFDDQKICIRIFVVELVMIIKLKINSMSINYRTEKQIMLYVYNGVLNSNDNNQTTVTCMNHTQYNIE